MAVPTAQPVDAYDWFGQCTSPAAGMQFSLFQVDGAAPVATLAPDAQGQVRFPNLAPGTYEVRPEGIAWCHAESDHVDANGNVLVEPQVESHVWSFVCGGGS
ncbi:MAG: prealbumin-like fold domain-containing protein [Thermomicrobiales bacterium]